MDFCLNRGLQQERKKLSTTLIPIYDGFLKPFKQVNKRIYILILRKLCYIRHKLTILNKKKTDFSSIWTKQRVFKIKQDFQLFLWSYEDEIIIRTQPRFWEAKYKGTDLLINI